MRKALFILMLAVVGVFVWVLMSSPERKPAWRPKTQIVFLGFTNLVAGAPATNAWFEIKDMPRERNVWRVVEISRQLGGSWNRWDPLPQRAFNWFSPGPTHSTIAATVPVETTNAPVRVVIELRRTLDGKVEKLLRTWRLNFLRLSGQPTTWDTMNRGPGFFITNEFNFATGTNPVAGR
jgi:hypothetical protein